VWRAEDAGLTRHTGGDDAQNEVDGIELGSRDYG
jgi:hypothetical protein